MIVRAELQLVLLIVCIRIFYCAKITNRITNGVTGDSKTYPYIVSLLEGRSFLCGGSLIRLDTVLTAAHCFRTYNNKTITKLYTVGAGNTNNKVGKTMRRIKVTYRHPNYQQHLQYSNDLAIAVLNETFVESPTIKPIMLPPSDFPWPAREKARVAGWGRTEYFPYPALLHHNILEVIRWSVCKRLIVKMGWIIDESMACAGDRDSGRDSCSGDSGGPLVYKDFLIGVVSWGAKNCGTPEVPGIYARVSLFVPWIWSHVKKPDYEKDREHFYSNKEIVSAKLKEISNA